MPDNDIKARLEELGRLGTTPAPEGQVWVCNACGKRSRTRYGFGPNNESTALDSGWDESCMMHAVLCYASPEPDFSLGECWLSVEEPDPSNG